MDSQGTLDGHGPGTGLGGGVGSKRPYDGSSGSSVVSFATDSVSVTQNSVASGSVANSIVGPDGRRSVKSVSIGCRQRVTVVCAECKRLKLKCDRRTPCGSCTKRDTIPRCIYSQAAAEKVDVQSLNIRLQAVEGKLNGISLPPGQTASSAGPSNTQNSSSSASPAAPSVAVPGFSTRRRAFLAVGGHGASIAVNLEGFAGLWVDHLGLNRPSERAHDVPVSVAELDLERLGVKIVRQRDGSGMDLRPSPSIPAAGVLDFIEENSRLFRVPTSLVTPSEVGIDTANNHADLEHDGHTSEDFEDEDNEQVGVSPELVRHALPSADIRKEIYKRFEQNHLLSPSVNLFVFKNRIEDMCQWAERQLDKTLSVNVGERVGENGTRDEPHPMPGVGSLEPSLAAATTKREPLGTLTPPTVTFFAAAAFGLALGARCWVIEQEVLNGSPSSAPGMRFASDRGGSPGSSNVASGSNPAAGAYDPTMPPPPPPPLFDTGASTSPASPASAHATLPSDTRPLHIHPSVPVKLYHSAKLAISLAVECVGYEAYDTDYIHAKCLQARYLLCSSHGLGECAGLLRDLGIGGRKKINKRKQEAQPNGMERGRERDAVMSDASVERTSNARRKGKEKAPARGPALAVAPEMAGVVGELVANARMMGMNHDPELASGGKFSVYEIEMRRRLWWEIVVLDAFVAQCLGERPLINDSSATTEFPTDVDEETFGPDSANRPAPNIESLHGNIDQLIQRTRIIDLTKRMKAKIVAFREHHPDAPASKTRDLLETMKKEYSKWEATLPDHLRMKNVPPIQSGAKISSPSPRRQPSSPDEHDSTTGEESPHLIAMRCRYNIMARHAFLGLCLDLIKSDKSGNANEKEDTSNSFFGRSAEGVDALVMLEPALFIVRAWRYLHSVYRNEHPALFMCYAFTKELFDAAVVLGHLAIKYPLYATPALASLRLAGETMRDPSVLTSKVTSSMHENDSLPSEAVRIIDELIAKVEVAAINAGPDLGGDSATSAIGSPPSVKRKHEEVEAASSDLLYHFRFPFIGVGVVSAGPPATPSDLPVFPTSGNVTTPGAGDPISRNGTSSSRSKHGAGAGLDATNDPRPAARHKASHPQISVRNRKNKDSSRARASSTASQRSDVSQRMPNAPSTTNIHGGATPLHGPGVQPNRLPSVEPSTPLLGPGSYPGPLSTTPGPGPPHYNSPPGTNGGPSSQPPQSSNPSEFSEAFHDSGNFHNPSPALYDPSFPPQSGPSLPVPSQVGFDSFNLDSSEQRQDGVSLGRSESATFGFGASSGIERPGPVGIHQPAGFDNIGGLPRPPSEPAQDRPFSRNLVEPRTHTHESDEQMRPPMNSLDHHRHSQSHPPLHPPQTYHGHSQVPHDWNGYSQWPNYFG